MGMETKTQIPLEDAQAIIQNHIEEIEEVTEMSIGQVQYRILAEDIYARINLPPFAKSPVDGYAIFHEDTKDASQENPITLQVIGEVLAGDRWKEAFPPQSAIRIMTGAPIPDGATCVIRQEDVILTTEQEVIESEEIESEETVRIVEMIEITKPLQDKENYCHLGEDIKEGELMIPSGTKLEYYHIGMLMAQGFDTVVVYRIPRILLITTGNELISERELLANPNAKKEQEEHMFQEGKIYNYNLLALKHRFLDWKVEVEAIHCRDSERRLCELIQRKAEEYDLIVTTGGVSVGKKDILHETYELLGVEKYFWKVNMKPGSPAMFTTYQDVPILSLSGNPYAALVTLEVLAKPIVKRLRRDSSLATHYQEGILQKNFYKTASVPRYVRVRIENNRVHIESKLHSSGAIMSMGNCNGFLEVPAGENTLYKGTYVKVLML